MSTPDVINNDLFVAGNLGARTFSPPAGCITDAAVAGAAGLSASKLQHQHSVRYEQKVGVAVAAESRLLHIARAAGSIVGVQVTSPTPPTSSDTVTVDVKVGNTATGYTTVLSAVVTLNSSSVAKTVYSGTITAPTYAAGDSIEVVVAVSGTSCQGLAVQLTLREAAD